VTSLTPKTPEEINLVASGENNLLKHLAYYAGYKLEKKYKFLLPTPLYVATQEVGSQTAGGAKGG